MIVRELVARSTLTGVMAAARALVPVPTGLRPPAPAPAPPQPAPVLMSTKAVGVVDLSPSNPVLKAPPPPTSAALPPGYTQVAIENGEAFFANPTDVIYGANGKFVFRYNVTGSLRFDNATFGDPIFGIVKAGYARPSASSPTKAQAPTSAATTPQLAPARPVILPVLREPSTAKGSYPVAVAAQTAVIPKKPTATLGAQPITPAPREPTVPLTRGGGAALAVTAKPATVGRPSAFIEKRPASLFATKERTDPARSTTPPTATKAAQTGVVSAAPDLSAGKSLMWPAVAALVGAALLLSGCNIEITGICRGDSTPARDARSVVSCSTLDSLVVQHRDSVGP